MTRFVEKVVGFGPALDGTRFSSAGSEGYRIKGDDGKELGIEASTATWMGAIDQARVGPLAKGVCRALETETGEVEVVGIGGVLHDRTDKIVGDGKHDDLATDHGRRLAGKDVHAHGCFDVTEKEFDGPAAQVEIGQIFSRIAVGIKEGGNEKHGGGSEPWMGDAVPDDAEVEGVRKSPPDLGGP